MMKEIDPSEWKHIPHKDETTNLLKVFISDKFLVQIRQDGKYIRLSINKIKCIFKDGKPIWEDGITWDEIQEIKNQCGFKDRWLCEYFPPHDKVINVANIRHLWLMENEPESTLNGTKLFSDKDMDPS